MFHYLRSDRLQPRCRLLVGLASALVLALVLPDPVRLVRAIENLPMSAVAVVWAKAHDGSCHTGQDLIVECSGMAGGYTNAGTTVGSVWMYGTYGGRERHRHETRHSDQWAMFEGGPLFPIAYGAEYLRTGGDLERNVFERWAGLRDGGYE